MALPRPILILGPTAGGKSELAVAIAQSVGGQVLGADSMQVYCHMNAGTAKPSPELRSRVVHHLIDIAQPTERFTVADWLQHAETLIENLQSQDITPVIVGGTNLYLKALLEGMFRGPPADSALRASWDDVSNEDLHNKLKCVDPDSATRIAPADRKRIIRALEVYETTGKPISQWQQQWSTAPGTAPGNPTAYRYDPILIGLEWSVPTINKRINQRVRDMFNPPAGIESLPHETARLESLGLLGSQACCALGYKQVLEHMAGEMSLDHALERTKILTRRFAKAQRTWLKRFRGVSWIGADNASPEQLAKTAQESVNQAINVKA